MRAYRGAARGDLGGLASGPVYRGVGAWRQLLLCRVWAMSGEGTVAAVCFRSQRAQWCVAGSAPGNISEAAAAETCRWLCVRSAVLRSAAGAWLGIETDCGNRAGHPSGGQLQLQAAWVQARLCVVCVRRQVACACSAAHAGGSSSKNTCFQERPVGRQPRQTREDYG